MEPTEKALDMQETCKALLNARFCGQLTAEAHDYELAKLTVECLDLYKPRLTPEKPMSLRKFEAMPEGEKERLGVRMLRQLTDDYKAEKEAWLKQCREIMPLNRTNLIYLQSCLKTLRERGHDGAEKVKAMIETHHQVINAARRAAA